MSKLISDPLDLLYYSIGDKIIIRCKNNIRIEGNLVVSLIV